MKNSTISAHWVSKKCASLGTINKNRYYLFIIIMLLTFGAGNAWGAETATFTPSVYNGKGGTAGSGGKASAIVADVTISSTKAYYTSEHIREYSNGEITLSSSNKITKIVITSIANKGKDYGPDKIKLKSGFSGTYATTSSSKDGTWTGNATSVTFSCNAQFRWTKVVVTYELEASCDKKVTLTKGLETNGTFTLDHVNGSYENCDADFVVKVSNVQPKLASQYCTGIEATGGNSTITGPVDGVWTVTYTKENNIISTITPIFTPKTPAKIVFENMGSPAPKTDGYYVGDTYTLPSENDFICGNRTFVGWSTVSIDNSVKKPTGDTYYEPGAEVTLEANNTFYAVFAEGSGEEVLTSITGGDWSNGLSAGWTTTGTGTYSGNGVKFDDKNDEVSSPDISSKKYKSLLLKFKSGYNGDKGSVLTFYTYKNDGTLLKDDNVTISPETVIPSDTYTNQTSIYQVRISASEVIGYVMIMMTSKTSNLGMKYCEIFGVSNSYQNYTTSCSEPVQTANYTIKHYQQNILDDEYTLVEADTEILSGEVGTEVTPEVKKYTGFTAPSTKTITISLDGSTVVDYKYNRNSYTLMWNLCGGTITKEGTAEGLVKFGATLTPPIVEKEGHNFKDWNSNPTTMPASDVTYTAQWAKLYTIIWLANGDEFHKQANAEEGTKLDVPTEEPTACEGKAFVGWTAKRDYAHTSQAPSDLFKTNDINVESAENVYYAVFATMTSIPGETTIEEVSTELDFSQQGYSNGQEVTSLTKGDVTIKLNNATKYYNTGTAVRVYGGGYFTVSVPNENTIGKIVLTFGDGSNTITTSLPTYENRTWTGKASSVTFSVGGSSGHRRIQVVAVTHTKTIQTEGSIEYSNYSTTCSSTPDVELQSIEISGDLTKKSYVVGESLDFNGLTVTANYSDETTDDVTKEVTWSEVSLIAEQTSVTLTANYNGKTDDITITGLTVSKPATPEPVEGDWVLTQWSDITCSDLVVITMSNSNGTYALTNGNGTKDAPAATKVEVGDNKLKSEPAEPLQWVMLNENGELTIYPINDYDKWLYCINGENNGVRVGNNASDKFIVDGHSGYMRHKSTERYVGVYNSSDWRCYTSINDNIKDQTLAFYVKKDANPNPCEDPVDDGIKPVATFIFNTAEGLRDLGIVYPSESAGNGASKNDFSNNESYTKDGITLTNVWNGNNYTRVWRSSAGNLDLRLYNGAEVKFSVSGDVYIRKIVFNGNDLQHLSSVSGELKGNTWTGKEQEVSFSVGGTVHIYTISFALEYSRTVTPGDFGTICLPYGSSNYSGAEFYEVAWLRENAGLYLDEIEVGTALEAGKPYIFKATENELVVVYEGDAKDKPVEGKNGLTGTFSDIAVDNTILEGNYIIAENQIWICGTGCWLNANRAYIMKSGLPTTEQALIPGRRRVCMGENAATGVDNLMESGVISAEQATKLLINGQLIIIRNGEKYNVQGQKL